MLHWIGVFHPLILHLPIGLVTGWMILEFCPRGKKNEITCRDSSLNLVAIFTALSAVAAAVTGFLLADSKPETFTGETVDNHRIWGIVFGSLCIVSAVVFFLLKDKGKARWGYRAVLVVTSIVLVPAGHLGGNLTHGEGYLTKDAPDFIKSMFGDEDEEEELTEVTQDSSAYHALVKPVLVDRCYACHAGSKKEGGVDLKTYVELEKVLGKDGDFVKSLHLPHSDDLHMPPLGKPQLKPNELSLLDWWAKSKYSETTTIAEVQVPEKLQYLVEQISRKELNLPPLDKGVVAALRKRQVFVHPVSAESELLWVEAAASAPRFTDEDLELLHKIAPRIQWLNLARTQLDDRALKLAAACENLTMLDLSYTKITDKGLKLIENHPYLERIVLSQTSVTKASLPVFESLKRLKKLSLWKTKISDDELKKWQKKLPKISTHLDQNSANK